MIIFRLLSLIRGYSLIKLDTTNYEKVLNLLQKRKIHMWDIEKDDNGISFKISNEDYRRHKELFESDRVSQIKNTGLMILYDKMKSRKGFSIGILIFILSYLIFTSTIWKFEIVGANHTLSKEIIQVLKDNNIKVPISSINVNQKYIESVLYKNFDSFKFVEVYVDGSKLFLFVKEKQQSEKFSNDKDPSNIIASKNAVINKIIAKSGQSVVKEGDVVYEGQLLVTGAIQKKNSEAFMTVPSIATVYGKTYYTFQMKEEKVKNVMVSTEKSKSVYYLKKNNEKIKIIGDTEPFENYNYREEVIKIPLISRLTNISIQKGIYYEKANKEIELDEELANNTMQISVYDDLKSMCNKDSKTYKSSLDFSQDDNYYYLNAQFEIIEDVGTNVKLSAYELEQYKSNESEDLNNTDATEED